MNRVVHLDLATEVIGQLLDAGRFTYKQLRALRPALYRVVPSGHPLRRQLKLLSEGCYTCNSTGLITDRSGGHLYPGTGAAYRTYLPCPVCGEQRGKQLHELSSLGRGSRVTVVHHQTGVAFKVVPIDLLWRKTLQADGRRWSRITGWRAPPSEARKMNERIRPWQQADDQAISELGEEARRRAAGG